MRRKKVVSSEAREKEGQLEEGWPVKINFLSFFFSLSFLLSFLLTPVDEWEKKKFSPTSEKKKKLRRRWTAIINLSFFFNYLFDSYSFFFLYILSPLYFDLPFCHQRIMINFLLVPFFTSCCFTPTYCYLLFLLEEEKIGSSSQLKGKKKMKKGKVGLVTVEVSLSCFSSSNLFYFYC